MKAINQNNEAAFTFHESNRPSEMLRIVPTEDGFDVVIPEHVTLTEAAQTFIDAVNELLAKRNPAI